MGIVPGVFIWHDREERIEPEVVPFTKSYFDKYTLDLKIKYCNINNALTRDIELREKIRIIKLMIKYFLKLKLSFCWMLFNQFLRINKTF